MIPKLQLVKCARQNSSRHQGLGKIFTIEETNKQKMEEDEKEVKRRRKEEEEKKLSLQIS